ncbi:DEAD-box ATP-dependent RNA helicase 21 [Hibiscus syriacus]|uniref:DEAD-box ATP-dependent RNA helicase 21 n=1 Tax=Hibiscus syriacus TaxID=106335 RepID=A0A6A3AVJ9_HIBSY|nr:DEAD-box ATP-dependent RNA helicase 21 [Hibiscus syriacus]
MVFLETVMGLAQQCRHCLIECIPVPREIAKQAPVKVPIPQTRGFNQAQRERLEEQRALQKRRLEDRESERRNREREGARAGGGSQGSRAGAVGQVSREGKEKDWMRLRSSTSVESLKRGSLNPARNLGPEWIGGTEEARSQDVKEMREDYEKDGVEEKRGSCGSELWRELGIRNVPNTYGCDCSRVAAKDVIGIAETAEGPYAVVMAPTRDLAQQIEDETMKFAHYLERQYAVLNQCNHVVLDEADRMIDMGFEPQVVGVLDAMPSTARWEILRNPVVVTIGTAGKATDLISQHVIMMKESEKFPRLQKLLYDIGDKTTIVFVNTKKNADTISKNLYKAGYKVTTLHGGRSQEQREIILEGFRAKRFNVLVATDVAGRGFDIPDVAHVKNYDMPSNIEMYTHRIGRTGRAGKTGVATTFLTLHDTDVFFDLKQMLIQSGSPIPPELAKHEASKFNQERFLIDLLDAMTLFLLIESFYPHVKVQDPNLLSCTVVF